MRLLFLLLPATLFASDAFVAGRVFDAGTGRLMPATVVIRTSAGKIVEDHPSFQGGLRSPGSFEARIPAGSTTITVMRGFDYGAETQTLDLRDAERREIEFRLRRRTPLHRLGWVCGDNHVHMIHGERTIEVDFPYVALSGRAEGLDYLAVCQQWNLPTVTPEALQAACARESSPGFLLTWNLESPKNYYRGDAGKCLGHGWTVGVRGRAPDGRDAISELLTMSAWDYQSEKPPTPNFEIQSFIHELGGIVSYTHPHRWWWGKWGGQGIYPVEEHKRVSNMAVELPFDTVAGPTYDTIDVFMTPEERETNRRALGLWFMLLNHGYRIPATASSDSTFDRPGGGVPGRSRVYTLVNGAPTPALVAAAMKAGRNFATTGPLVLFELGGHSVGDVVRAQPGLRLEAHVQAWPSGAPGERLTRVELIRNGEVVKTWDAPAPGAGFTAVSQVPASETSWYVARVYGSGDKEVAITNPVYVEGAEYKRPTAQPAHVLATVRDRATGAVLDGTIDIVRMDGRKPVTQSSKPVRGGRVSLTMPATSRLRVQARGYAPQTKSVFLDCPALLDLTLNMTPEQISDWATYDRIRTLLKDVHLDFALERTR